MGRKGRFRTLNMNIATTRYVRCSSLNNRRHKNENKVNLLNYTIDSVEVDDHQNLLSLIISTDTTICNNMY